MSLTRIVWMAGLLLVVAALAVLVLDDGSAKRAGDAAAPEREPAAPQRTPAATAPAPAKPAATAPAAPKPPVERAPDAVNLGLDVKIKDATVVAGNIVPRPDPKGGGTLLYADGKYEIRGAGTAENPYKVSWECLASAQESFIPRLGEREIPQRVAMLHDKVVEIDGYLAFPLMVTETKELLVMLNQWDGCCIGVPPTPYDAIEVKLLQPAKRGGRHATFNFGGVRGTLKVDPYLVENWLVGLYILDGASMVDGKAPEL
jgi:hypothetical protein